MKKQKSDEPVLMKGTEVDDGMQLKCVVEMLPCWHRGEIVTVECHPTDDVLVIRCSNGCHEITDFVCKDGFLHNWIKAPFN